MSAISKFKKRLLRRLNLIPKSFETRMAPIVSGHANEILSQSIENNNKNALFIDMGSNLGQGFTFFSKYYNPNKFDYWLIEANPYCIEILKTNISNLYTENAWTGAWKVINKAISNKNGKLKLYGLVEDHRGNTSDGASVLSTHNSVFYESDETQAIEVNSIRASDLLNNASKEYATIVIKMDIESSEYDALEDIITTHSIDKFTHIYVEWHSQFFSSEKINDILIRENNIKEHLSGKLTNWH